MKLAQLQEARYAGEHPVVKEINASLASGELDFYAKYTDKKKAHDAELAIIAAFGQPDESGSATEDVYRNMTWYLDDVLLQLVDGLPYKKKLAHRSGETISFNADDETYTSISMV